MNKYTKGALITLLLTGSVLPQAFAAEDVNGEDALPIYNLQELVVTATRTEQSVKEVPSAVQIISKKDLERKESKTLKDALKNAVGVSIHNDFQGRSNVSIRGSESRHVLILVDGKRMSGEIGYNSANANDLDRIMTENVEKVEIIRGPAGALYGSDAIGGVINIITKVPDKNVGTIKVDYPLYENGNAAGPTYNLNYAGISQDKNFTYNVNVTRKNTKAYRDDNGDDVNYHGDETPVSLSAGYKFSNGNKLTADFSKFYEDTTRETTSAMGTMSYKKLVNQDNKRTDYSLAYSGADSKQNWKVRAYQSVYDKSYDSFSFLPKMMGGTQQTMADRVKRTISVVEGQDSWRIGAKNYLTGGAEWRRDHSEGTRIKKPGTSLGSTVKNTWDEADLDYAAAYIQDEYKPDKRWLIIPSLRYDWSSEFSSRVTARIATTYNIKDDLRLKAVVGQGYKTPTVSEMYMFWEMYGQRMKTPGQFFEGNPDIKPEKSLNYELSLEKDWGEKTTAHVGIFRNDVTDLINTYWTGKYTTDYPKQYPGIGKDMIMKYRNVDKAVMQGIELSASHSLTPNINLTFGYTYLDAKDADTDQRLTDRAQQAVTLGLAYTPENKYAWDCSLDLESNIGYYALNNATEKNETKNFTIVNIMTQKQIAKDAKIYFGIDNIGNYQSYGDYSLGNVGRMYRMGLVYKF